jgi:hypothetical protein
MAKNLMKNYSISLAIKEKQIKTTLRFQLKPVRMAVFLGIRSYHLQIRIT